MKAVLNEKNICIFITDAEEMEQPFVEIEERDVSLLGKCWSNGEWKTPMVYEPTNAEVAQMISDLQADLMIAGVI